MDELLKWLTGRDSFACDTETTGLFDFSNKVILLQIGDGKDQWIIDTRNVDTKPLKKFFEDRNILKIFHNAKFDVKFIRFSLGFHTEGVYDTFLAECLLTNGRKDARKSLAEVSRKYCGIEMSKDERMTFTKTGAKPFKKSQLIYAALDVQFLHEVRSKQLVEIEKWDLLNVLNLENDCVIVFADIEYNGMLLDTKPWLIQAEKVEAELVELQKVLDSMLIREVPHSSFINKGSQLSLFTEEVRTVSINWVSPPQLRILFLEMGLDVDTTSEKDIAIHEDKSPLIKKIIEYKKLKKKESTYGRTFLNYINPVTGRIHTSIKQILETGRISTGNGTDSPNMQNLPASNTYRNPFIARSGFKIVSCDFAGQEARLAASGSKDDVWCNAFRQEKDLHSEVAAMVFRIDPDRAREKPDHLGGKSYRDVAKTINFAILYGASEYKISKQLNIPLQQAKDIIESYFKATPKLINYLNNCAKYALKNGYIRSYKPYSLIRWIPGWRPNLNPQADKGFIGQITRLAYNTPVQASGAMMTKLALVKLRDYINSHNLQKDVFILMAVHDQIDVEVKEHIAEDWAKIQKAIMEEAGRELITEVPVLSDITIGDCWKKG